MSADWWRMPGPAAWVAELAATLTDGQSLVLALPEGLPPGLREALGQAASRLPPLLVSTPDERRRYPPDRPLAHLAARHYGASYPDLITADDLVTILETHGKTLWLDRLATEEWPAWRDLLVPAGHIIRGLSPASRPRLVIPLTGPLALDTALAGEIIYRHDSWRAASTHLDHLLWATALARSRPDESDRLREVVVTLVAELARGDANLAAHLVAADLDLLCDPGPLLGDYAQSRGWGADTLAQARNIGRETAWAAGLIETDSDIDSIHSALLALAPTPSPDAALLARRVWVSQLRALFPWLEEQRWLLIDHAAHLLIPPFSTSRGKTVESAADLDLGEIAWHLRHKAPRRTAADYALSRLADDLANARNQLAHRHPLPGQTIQTLVQTAPT